MGQRRHYPIRLVPIEFLLQQAEYSSRHSQRVAGQRWGQVGRNEGCEFHRLAFVGRLSRNAPAVVEDPGTRSGSCAPRCTACSGVRRLRKTCSTDCNAL